MPTCKHCHGFKKKSLIRKHEKNCSPTKADIEHYTASKSAKHKRKNEGKR